MAKNTDKFIKNVLKGQNLAAKENLQDMIKGKIESKVKKILEKGQKDGQA